MTIKSRLLLSWALIALAVAIISFGMDRSIRHVQTGLDLSRNQSLKEIESAAVLSRTYSDMATVLGEVITLSNEDVKDLQAESEQRLAHVNELLKTAMATLAICDSAIKAESLSDGERKRPITNILSDIHTLTDCIQQSLSHLPVNEKERAVAIEKIDAIADQLGGLSLEFQHGSTRSLMARLDNLSGTLSTIAKLGPWVMMFVFGASLYVALRIASKAMQRLGKMRAAAERIGEGNLNEPIADNQPDELGQVANAIDGMADRLKLLLKQLEHDAVHDALTKMPNRVLFKDRVEQILSKSHKTGRYASAVMFCDLDRFKLINDSLGHAAGDELLKTIAVRLEKLQSDGFADKVNSVLPETLRMARAGADTCINTVARLGGDEFTLLIDGLPPGHERVAVEAVAEKIRAVISEPMMIAGSEIVMTPSIGVSLVDARYTNASDLLRDADSALYRAKTGGRAKHVVFDSEMYAQAVERLKIESELRAAMDRQEFELYYQPITELHSGKLLGFESLIRWNRNNEVIAPVRFISIAEETGLIVQLGEWVIEQACRQLQLWEDIHGTDKSVSVNVSRRQLADANLIPHIKKCLETYQITPERLIVEITESMFIDQPDAHEVIESIRKLGVRIYIDDFGTGYSSLSCLNIFPADGLKIDRSFVSERTLDRDHQYVLRAIVKLAHDLGMPVVAEGVESTEQVALLNSIDCDQVQGYLYARPLTVNQVEVFMQKRPPAGGASSLKIA